MTDQASTHRVNEGIESGRSFEERIGAPDPFTSALGYVVLSFASLELLASRHLMRMMAAPEPVGVALSAELSFANKIHLLSSLVRLRANEVYLNHGKPDPVAAFTTIAGRCFRAEELRNLILHSYWDSVPLEPERMLRFKRSAKAKHGLRVTVEELGSDAVLDVADFIEAAANKLDMFFYPKPWGP